MIHVYISHDQKKIIDYVKEKASELEGSMHEQKNGSLYKAILAEIEKPLIEHILDETGGNQLKSAKILGMNRNTIRSKIKRLGIDVSKWKV